MPGDIHAPETRSDSLRKPVSIWRLIQFFRICEVVDGPDMQNPFVCEAHYTYIHTSSAIGNPPQGERVWNTLHRHSTFETYIPTSQSAVCYKYAFQNHPPCEGFLQSWTKTRLPVGAFVLSSHFGTARYVCSKTHLPVIPFVARHTYIHTRLEANLKRYAKRVCFKTLRIWRKMRLGLNVSQ